MRNDFHSLSEKDRCRYAAAEAIQLGHGGVTYEKKRLWKISTVTAGCTAISRWSRETTIFRTGRNG